MKTCTKCGCVYDDSFAACPTCNKTVEKEIVDKIGVGLIGILLIVIFVPMAIASETFAPMIFGLIIFAFVIAVNKKRCKEVVKSEIPTNKSNYTPKKHIPADQNSIKKYYETNARGDGTRIFRAKYEPFIINKLNVDDKTADILNKKKYKISYYFDLLHMHGLSKKKSSLQAYVQTCC